MLLSAPKDVVRSTATTVFASAVSALSQVDLNPLVAGDRDNAFKLAHGAYLRLMDNLDDPALRTDLCLAAFLQNRAEDDGRGRFRGGAFSGNYAVSTALHIRYPAVGQGESTSVVHAPAMRLADDVDLQAARQVAEGIGVWADGMDAPRATRAIAEAVENIYTRSGVPTQLRQLDIPRDDLIKYRQGNGEKFQRQRRRALGRSADSGLTETTRSGLVGFSAARRPR